MTILITALIVSLVFSNCFALILLQKQILLNDSLSKKNYQKDLLIYKYVDANNKLYNELKTLKEDVRSAFRHLDSQIKDNLPDSIKIVEMIDSD